MKRRIRSAWISPAPVSAGALASKISRAKVIKKKRKRPVKLTMPTRKKNPGFDAFEVEKEVDDEKKIVQVVAPETGIHSKDWARKISPQGSGLLRLPIEVRNRIYSCVLLSSTEETPYNIIQLRPQKCLDKFINVDPYMAEATSLYTDLSLVCRQMYVEVTGSGVLHSLSDFKFTSLTLMYNYLDRINPAHKDCIRSVWLHIKVTEKNTNIPAKVFQTLASLPSLQYLELDIYVNISFCILVTGSDGGVVKICEEGKLDRIETNKGWELLRQKLRTFEIDWIGNYAPWRCPANAGNVMKAKFKAMTDNIGNIVLRKK